MNDCQDKVDRLTKEKDILEHHLKEEEDRDKIFGEIISERQKILAQAILSKSFNEDVGGQALETVNNLSKIHQQLKRTYFSALAQEMQDYLGLKGIIEKSNSQLRIFKKEIERFRKKTDDPLYDFNKCILEAFEDNIELRIMLNQYIEVILTQAGQKLEEAALDLEPEEFHNQVISVITPSRNKKENIKNEKEKKAREVRATVGGMAAADNSRRPSVISNHSSRSTMMKNAQF